LLLCKSKALALVRRFFASRGFVEWQTPRLVASPGIEVHLKGFETHYLDRKGGRKRCYLPTSPEFSLKKALCAGMDRIYEICRCFRNGGESGPLHQCEFTMIEWYRTYVDYEAIMRDVEELAYFLEKSLRCSAADRFRGRRIDWTPPWPRTSLKELFLRHCSIDLGRALKDLPYFRRQSSRFLSQDATEQAGFDDLFFQLFLSKIEPNLGLDKPEILYDYPAHMSALAATKPGEPAFAERCEVYVSGVELANGFTELNDPFEQRARFEAALREKRALGYPEVPVDQQFLQELEYGMPPAAGIALGLERLLMAIAGVEDIAMLFFLPHQWEQEDEQLLWPMQQEAE
ncbi:MAG: EF-P lysine aminoacylase GenX, partial [Deltaproteobacteria bacterium]|nr:EF-P lysine aminoacylase GenX [Deltaproteobacteria bacterium]